MVTTWSPRAAKRSRLVGVHLALLVMALLSFFPVLLLVSTAFKSSADVRVNPFGLFTTISPDSIVRAWTTGRFAEYTLNSLVITVPATVVTLIVCTLAGYAFARLPFPGRGAVYVFVLIGLFVPFFTYMIPLYFQLRSFGLLNSLAGVILVLTAAHASFGIFFMRAFFAELPSELEQSARIDGCSSWQVFTRVMLPLVRSGMASLAVLMFLFSWNNLLVPLLYLPSGSWRPLTSALFLIAGGGRTTDIGPLAAGALISIVPVVIVFLLLQRQLVRGFLAGAVKG